MKVAKFMKQWIKVIVYNGGVITGLKASTIKSALAEANSLSIYVQAEQITSNIFTLPNSMIKFNNSLFCI